MAVTGVMFDAMARVLKARVVLVLCITALGSCGDFYPGTVIDGGSMPAPKAVLAEPVFARLKFHSPLHLDDQASYKPIAVEKFEYWADSEVLSRATTIVRYGYLAQGRDDRGRTMIRRNVLGVDIHIARVGDGAILREVADTLERHVAVEKGRLNRLIKNFLDDPNRAPTRYRSGNLTVKIERRSVIGLQNDYIALTIFDDTFAD